MSSTMVRILVVDDSRTMRTAIKNKLAAGGYTDVQDADGGPTGQSELSRSVAEAKPFHLVLCDWAMPTMTGLELLQWAKKQPALASVPFIMVTAENGDEQVQMAKAAGALGFVTKPFTDDTLLSLVASALARGT